jgi:hypothetical protein
MEIPSDSKLILQLLLNEYSLMTISKASRLSLKTLYRILSDKRISKKSDFALVVLYCQWQIYSKI